MKEPKITDGQRWGRWVFDAYSLTLLCEDCYGNGYGYQVDLETCGTSAEMLDWIMQVTDKSWCTPEDTRDFVAALRDLLNPQATLCMWGVDKPLDVSAYLRKHQEKTHGH